MMASNRALLLNFDLGETADAIRETVHAFSQNEIAPRAAEIDRSNQFPRDSGPKSERSACTASPSRRSMAAPASAISNTASQ